MSSRITGPVRKIEFNGMVYILKNISGQKHRLPYLFQTFFRGSYVFRLMRAAARAAERNDGNRAIPEIFLVAERKKFGFCLESYILMEFIDGAEVGDIPDGVSLYGAECAQAISWMHRNGIVHGDINTHNFIVEKRTGKVFAIDVSGKVPTIIQKAKDRAKLEQVFGIKNKLRDFGWFWVTLSSRRKAFFQKLKTENIRNACKL